MPLSFYFFDLPGRTALAVVRSTHAHLTSLFAALMAVGAPREKGGGVPVGETLRQVYFSGAEGLLPTSVLALGIGLSAGLYSNADLLILGGDQVLSRLLVQISVEAIGPFLISLLAIARSGTAIASELGTMCVNHEVEALRVMCRNPQGFLVFPRIYGGSVALVCLGTAYTVVLILAYTMASYLSEGTSPFLTFGLITGDWSLGFLVFLLTKYALSAIVVFTIACRQGLSVQRSSYEVPRVTSSAVLQSIYAIFLLHAGFAGAKSISLMPGVW